LHDDQVKTGCESHDTNLTISGNMWFTSHKL
jgi:hypothetical protein